MATEKARESPKRKSGRLPLAEDTRCLGGAEWQGVGQRIQVLRTELGLTQTEMAERASISRGWLNAIERGNMERHNVSVETVLRVCQVLGCTLDYLFGLRAEQISLEQARQRTKRAEGDVVRLIHATTQAWDARSEPPEARRRSRVAG
jgi:transcriptional regulator with XRE-family HTH domain